MTPDRSNFIDAPRRHPESFNPSRTDGELDSGGLRTAEAAYPSREDYDLALHVLGRLGMTDAELELLPDRSTLVQSLSPVAYSRLIGPQGENQPPELTMGITLSDNFSLYDLLARYDEHYNTDTDHRFRGSFIHKKLWDHYGPEDHNQASHPGHFALLLNDFPEVKERKNAESPGTTKVDPAAKVGLSGLYMNPTQQRDAVREEAVLDSIDGVSLRPLSVTQYIVLQAKRREAGQPPLDHAAAQTVFSQYRAITVGTKQPWLKFLQVHKIPVVHSSGDKLWFTETSEHYQSELQGSRRIVEL